MTNSKASTNATNLPSVDSLLLLEADGEEAVVVPLLALASAGFIARWIYILRFKLCAAAARMTASVKSVGLRSTLANRREIH